MSENKPNQPTKFRTKKWVEINDDSRGTYYSDAYIFVSGTITITGAGDDDTRKNKRNKGVRFKDCVPFTHCITEINNAQIDHATYIDAVMPMYNLIEYSDNYQKT